MFLRCGINAGGESPSPGESIVRTELERDASVAKNRAAGTGSCDLISTCFGLGCADFATVTVRTPSCRWRPPCRDNVFGQRNLGRVP